MQENDPLISVLKILALIKLCGSVLTWKEMKMTRLKENERCSRWWEFPVPLGSSVCHPASPAGAAGGCASGEQRLSQSNCSERLSCTGVQEPSFTLPVRYNT